MINKLLVFIKLMWGADFAPFIFLDKTWIYKICQF
jgi:hypothetical protein